MKTRTARTIVLSTGAAIAVALGGSSSALAQEHVEYQCSEGILGTGVATKCTPIGEEPPTDPWAGGPLGSDSDLANTLRGVIGTIGG